MLEAFAMVVLLVLVGAGIWLIVLIGNIPGNIARAEEHPQAEAITYLAWIGLLTLGLGWFVALVWAKTKPFGNNPALEARVEQLESELAALRGQA